MNDETTDGPTRASDDGRHRESGGGEQSPLQSRAAFFQNWSWESVVGLNSRLCARGGAQHGINSESGSEAAERWEALRGRQLTLAEAIDELRGYHRLAPFLFFNGNTFADTGRALGTLLFRELPTTRLRQVTSAIAHYIAGVLDREAMVAIVESLCESAEFAPGDRVKTLRGSLCGEVVRVLDDGRLVWCPKGTTGELIALPESLARDDR